MKGSDVTPYYETELGVLYHGDCLQIMPMLEPVDLVLAGTIIALEKRDRRRVKDRILSRLVRFVRAPEFSANLYYRDCDLNTVLKHNPHAVN